MSSDNRARTALLLVDLQNDFLHADGAYACGGASDPDIASLPSRLLPLVKLLRSKSAAILATQFTIVPGPGGEPIISSHLKSLRPFLKKGDFSPGSWGQRVVDELQPIDMAVEKVAYSAFYMTRLEWLLRKTGIEALIVGGIVTNGGVSSTVRDAHVRDIPVTVLSDGCAAFGDATHRTALDALQPVARIASIADVMKEWAS